MAFALVKRFCFCTWSRHEQEYCTLCACGDAEYRHILSHGFAVRLPLVHDQRSKLLSHCSDGVVRDKVLIRSLFRSTQEKGKSKSST